MKKIIIKTEKQGDFFCGHFFDEDGDPVDEYVGKGKNKEELTADMRRVYTDYLSRYGYHVPERFKFQFRFDSISGYKEFSNITETELVHNILEIQQEQELTPVLLPYKKNLDANLRKKVKEVYHFWNELDERCYTNIFKDISEEKYIEMVINADFGSLYKKKNLTRVGFTAYTLSKLINDEYWTAEVEKKLNKKMSEFQKNKNAPECKELSKKFHHLFQKRISHKQTYR